MVPGGFWAETNGGDQLMLTDLGTLPYVWNYAEPMLKKTWEMGFEEDLDLDQVYHDIKTGRNQLWMANDTTMFICAIVTECTEYNCSKVVRLKYIGLDDIETLTRVSPFLLLIQDWAKDIGATKLRVEGRKAWVRVLKQYGFVEKRVVLEKDLTSLIEGVA